MKKIFMLTLPFLLFSCNGVEKHRSDIESLAQNWGATTTHLTEFSESMNQAIGAINNKIAPMAMSQDALNELTPELKNSWSDMVTNIMESMGGYSPLQSGLAELMNSWAGKAGAISSLQSGLAEGKLDPSLIAQIPELNDMVSGAAEKLTGWKTSLDEQNAKTNSVVGQMEALFNQINGGE